MKYIVLDSSIVVAYFLNEEGAHVLEQMVDSMGEGDLVMCMSMFNFAEVSYTLSRSLTRDIVDEKLNLLRRLPVKLIVPTAQDYERAADLKARYHIAFGDCFAMCVAQDMQATIYTKDKEFHKVSDIISTHIL